ncbi:hypothetical protein AAVH_33531, partial [Aphelenchoides avenae]
FSLESKVCMTNVPRARRTRRRSLTIFRQLTEGRLHVLVNKYMFVVTGSLPIYLTSFVKTVVSFSARKLVSECKTQFVSSACPSCTSRHAHARAAGQWFTAGGLLQNALKRPSSTSNGVYVLPLSSSTRKVSGFVK